MGRAALQIITTGCILCILAVSISATCQDLETCYMNAGSSIPSGQNSTAITNFFCKTTDKLLTCYDYIQDCETYQIFLSLFPSKTDVVKRMKILCAHMNEYNQKVECIAVAQNTMSETDIQKSDACIQGVLQVMDIEALSKNCNSLNSLIACSPLMKAVFKCIADLVILMNNNGINVPCMNVYKPFASGSNLNVYSTILLSSMWFLAFLTQRFYR